MEQLFASLLTSNSSVLVRIVCVLVALLFGFIISLIGYYKGNSSKGFYITLALIPMSITMIIMFVNSATDTNAGLGAGVAVAGAFSLVRFRSAQGSAREIGLLFIAMALGFACGSGYIAYGVVFLIVSGLALMILTGSRLFEHKNDTTLKLLKVTVPENLDYISMFDDLFEKYTTEHTLVKAKSSNMGSLFILSYNLKLKDASQEKNFVDEIRTRNGNLEVQVGIVLKEERDL